MGTRLRSGASLALLCRKALARAFKSGLPRGQAEKQAGATERSPLWNFLRKFLRARTRSARPRPRAEARGEIVGRAPSATLQLFFYFHSGLGGWLFWLMLRRTRRCGFTRCPQVLLYGRSGVPGRKLVLVRCMSGVTPEGAGTGAEVALTKSRL